MSVRKRTWKTVDGTQKTGWMVDIIDTNGHRERRQFESRKEAEAFRIKTEGDMHAGTFRADASKLTVKDAASQFLTYCDGRRERGERMTRRNYDTMDGHIHNYICRDPKRHKGKVRPKRLKEFDGEIGGLRLSQLTTRAVNDFRDDLRKAGVSVVTTRKILSTLKQILTYAIGRDMVAINVARGVEVIGRRNEGPRKIVPPSKEIVRALLSIADEDFRVKLAFSSATGVRASELHALRWRHLDLAGGEAEIETRVDAYGEEDVTKTKAGMRTIPLSQPLVLSLKAWKLRAKRKKPDDLVFPNKRGWYTNHDNMIKRKFKPLLDRLKAQHREDPTQHPKLPAHFNWHALRHFAISCWIEADLKPKTVQTFAGHSSLQLTMDTYGHLFKSDDHKAAMNLIATDLFG